MSKEDRRKEEYEAGVRDTTDGKPPQSFDTAAPGPIGANGQHAQYWVLSEAERAKGFVRPVRSAYRHEKCGTVTTMGRALSETYRDHFPVGEHGEFTWVDSDEKVGT